MEWHDPHPIKKEELNPLEAHIEISYESKRKDVVTSLAGALASCTAAYAAFRKLPKPIRAPTWATSIGGLLIFGHWMFTKSFDSDVDKMLALNGTMLQKRVATYLLTHYSEHPPAMQLLSKHFYPERILDDSTSDTAKLRWRYRNIFSDNVVHGHGTLALDDFYCCRYDPYYKFKGSSYNDSYDSKRTTLRTKQNYIKPEPDIVVKVVPFGDFGVRCDATVEEINQPNTLKKSKGTRNQSHRRFHRRR